MRRSAAAATRPQLLERLNAQGRVVALDRDPDALRAGRERFAGEARLTLRASPFSRLAALLEEMELVGRIDGVLLDLGVSSPQLDDAARGFSFAHDGPSTCAWTRSRVPALQISSRARRSTSWHA
jgi:16S rRNA (cytosine1402-N4)-methyltransferase